MKVNWIICFDKVSGCSTWLAYILWHQQNKVMCEYFTQIKQSRVQLHTKAIISTYCVVCFNHPIFTRTFRPAIFCDTCFRNDSAQRKNLFYSRKTLNICTYVLKVAMLVKVKKKNLNMILEVPMVGVILPDIFQPSWTKRVVCLTRLLSGYGASECSVREVFNIVVYFYHSYLSVITTLWTLAALQLQTGNNATSFWGTLPGAIVKNNTMSLITYQNMTVVCVHLSAASAFI